MLRNVHPGYARRMSEKPESSELSPTKPGPAELSEEERRARVLANQPDPIASGFRPIFLDPERAATAKYVELDPDQVPNFDHWDNQLEPNPEPGSTLKPRHKEIARLHALGKTNNQICDILGYSTSRVSILLHTPEVQREVDRYRNRLYEKDLVSAIKELGNDAVATFEEALRSGKLSIKERLDPAKWVLEKLSGKAKQEINVESNTLAAFMDELKRMKETNQPIDVTPITVTDSETGEIRQLAAPSTDSKHAKWLEDNL